MAAESLPGAAGLNSFSKTRYAWPSIAPKYRFTTATTAASCGAVTTSVSMVTKPSTVGCGTLADDTLADGRLADAGTFVVWWRSREVRSAAAGWPANTTATVATPSIPAPAIATQRPVRVPSAGRAGGGDGRRWPCAT